MNKQELNNYLVTIPMTVGAIISFLSVMGAMVMLIVTLLLGVDTTGLFRYPISGFLFGGLLMFFSFFVTFIQHIIEQKGLR